MNKVWNTLFYLYFLHQIPVEVVSYLSDECARVNVNTIDELQLLKSPFNVKHSVSFLLLWSTLNWSERCYTNKVIMKHIGSKPWILTLYNVVIHSCVLLLKITCCLWASVYLMTVSFKTFSETLKFPSYLYISYK